MILEKKDDFKLDIKKLPPELRPVASEMKDFVEMRALYRSAIREVSTKLEVLDDEFHIRQDYNPIHHMECRVKSAQSIIEKMERKDMLLSMEAAKEITDIAGVRVICNYIDDIYKIAEYLTKQDDVTLIKRRDYIKEPKESGYRSLHLVIKIPVFLSDSVEHVPVEIQIRTIAMDTWASLEHELKYKNKGNVPKEIEERLQECAAEMADVDKKMQRIHRQL